MNHDYPSLSHDMNRDYLSLSHDMNHDYLSISYDIPISQNHMFNVCCFGRERSVSTGTLGSPHSGAVVRAKSQRLAQVGAVEVGRRLERKDRQLESKNMVT